MWINVLRNTTSVVVPIRMELAGESITGKAYGDLTASLWQPGTPSTQLTLEGVSVLGTYEAPSSASHLRIAEIDATNQPGQYELHLPNAWTALLAPAAFMLTILSDGVAVACGLAMLRDSLSVTLGPTNVIQAAGNVVGDGVTHSIWRGTKKVFPITFNDSDGNPVSHTGKTYRYVVGDNNTPVNAQFAKSGGDITLSGDDNEVVLVTVGAADSDIDLPAGHWWLIDTETLECPAHGEFIVLPAAVDVV